MNKSNLIYPFKKNIERLLIRIELDKFNGDVIRRYYHSRVADGLTEARICKCIGTLLLISKLLRKPFVDVNKQDIVELISEIERRDYSGWTKRDYKVVLKQFYRWLRNYEEGTPPEVRWIKISSNIENKRPILPPNLLTNTEKLAMLAATENPRDRALLEAFFESGRRLGELLTITIGDIQFDSIGAKISINGKIGADYCRIISSTPSLATWLDIHPLKNDPKAPVWIGLGSSNRLKQITYAAARGIIKKVGKRAGIKKRMHSYLFRHTRIDETQGILTEAQQCMMFGWKFGSRMPSVYFKRYGKHIDNAQSIMNGISPPKKELVDVLKSKACLRCKTDNSPASSFCNKCGAVLDSSIAVQIDEGRNRIDDLLNKITSDPERLKKLLALLSSD